MVAVLFVEQKVPEHMEEGDASGRCGPTHEKCCGRSRMRELCDLGQQSLGAVRPRPACSSHGASSGLQEWYLGDSRWLGSQGEVYTALWWMELASNLNSQERKGISTDLVGRMIVGNISSGCSGKAWPKSYVSLFTRVSLQLANISLDESQLCLLFSVLQVTWCRITGLTYNICYTTVWETKVFQFIKEGRGSGIY